MRPLSMRQRIPVVAGFNMAKGGRRNSQKKKKNSKANEDIDNENGDEGDYNALGIPLQFSNGFSNVNSRILLYQS